MPAFRATNLRYGDLAEHLAITLLQSVALVAPVPRTEDVGIDAVVTLLRPFDSNRLIAEDSIYVQVKSASVQSIEFKDEQVKWLYTLELPMFFASVDRKANSISLFCSQEIAKAFVTNNERKRLVVHFDSCDPQEPLVAADVDDVHLGPPVMIWDMYQIGQEIETVREMFNNIVKAHLQVQRDNILHRSIARVENCTWETNQLPRRGLFCLGPGSSAARRLDIAYERMMPFFLVWHLELLFTRDWSSAHDVMSLLEKAKNICESE